MQQPSLGGRTRAVAPTLPSGDKEVPRGCFNADFTGDTAPDGRVGATARVLPPSELSDGTSVASDEGSRVDTSWVFQCRFHGRY
jgi:hypothetical protein